MSYSTIEDLQSLIDNQIGESTTLEYKSSFAKQKQNWREELAKDISAMANANGGTIIYGIREKSENSIAGDFTPIPNSEMSQEQLSQLLSSNIQPIIEGLIITHIPFDKQSGFYVVNVPKGVTAHQNRLSHVYYTRRNSTVEAMEDYEIRDVMNRRKNPIIDIEFSIVETITDVHELGLPILGNNPNGKYYQEKEFTLAFQPTNNGEVFAKYINYFVFVPKILIDNSEQRYQEQDEYVLVFGDNTIRDLMSIDIGRRQYGPARYDPILPGVRGRRESIKLVEYEPINNYPLLKYEMHADNSPTRIVYVNWADINITIQNRSVTKNPLSNTSCFF